MPTRSKTVQQQFAERALVIWTIRQAVELAWEALLLVWLLMVVLKTATALL